MLNFKRKRVLNPNLMVKFVVLSILIGVFTMVASFPVDAAQISLEEELAILTGRDNHSKYLPDDSEEEEEDYYDPSERSMMLEHISVVDIPPTEEFTRANKICKAYDDAMLAAENCKNSINLHKNKDAPTTGEDFKKQITNVSFFAHAAVDRKIDNYKENHSKEETEAFSAASRACVQDYMFDQMRKAKNDALPLGIDIYFAPIVLRGVPSEDDIPWFDVELRDEQNNSQNDEQNEDDIPWFDVELRDEQNNSQNDEQNEDDIPWFDVELCDEQNSKQQGKHGDLCPCLLI